MPPLSIMIKPVSGKCTMRCKYCFYADVTASRSQADMGQMNHNTMENLVRRAMAYADGSVSFSFQGGEPTLAGIDFFREFMQLERKFRRNGLMVNNSIQTNGYRIDDELLKFLADNNFLFGVSLDGSQRIHDRLRLDASGKGTYSEIIKTLERLTELRADFNVVSVVNKYVAENARECFDSLAEYGYIQFIPCIDAFNGEVCEYSLSPEMYGNFLKEIFDLYYRAFMGGGPVSIRNFDNYIGILLGKQPENCGMCGHCGNYFLIEGNGGVYPCDFYVLDQWCMGNINTSSFFKLGSSEIGEQFRRISYYISPECRKCSWLYLCRGGCRRDREPFKDGIPEKNRWCSSFKMFFEYAYPRMCKLAEKISGYSSAT